MDEKLMGELLKKAVAETATHINKIGNEFIRDCEKRGGSDAEVTNFALSYNIGLIKTTLNSLFVNLKENDIDFPLDCKNGFISEINSIFDEHGVTMTLVAMK